MSKKPLHKQKQKKPRENSSNLSFGNNDLVATLDLHGGLRDFEETSLLVDRFLVTQRIKNLSLIKRFGKIKLGIVVGSGHNSKRMIHGKNPLRHFVETYLAQTDINWHNDWTNTHSSALIIVELEF